MKTHQFLACLGVVASLGRVAYGLPGAKHWSIEEMHGPAIPFEIRVEESTWTSLDVSPDGKTLVFDLLGDLYTLPVVGGEARRITMGPAYDGQPRFSPDGKRIAFVSDRDGKSNVWLVDPDGQNPTAVTREENATLYSPAWTPDGRDLIVTRHDDLQPATTSELYDYSVRDGAGKRLISQQRDPLGGVVTPDGQSIYFSHTNDLPAASLERFNRQTGEITSVVSGAGGAVRPVVSPNGRWLAYGRRSGAQERLVLRDLNAGTETILDATPDLDQQGNVWRDADELPGYAFSPDSSAIIYSGCGKLWRHDLAKNVSTNIPFRARFSQDLQQQWTMRNRIDRGPVRPKLLRWTHESPDGKTLYFSAAGKNYRYDVATGRAGLIGDGPWLTYSPAVSPDGRWLAYATWSDKGGGHIFKTSTTGPETIRLTETAGLYEHLAWSADGTKLVFIKGTGDELRGESNVAGTVDKEICWLATAAAGPVHGVTHVMSRGDRRQEMRPRFDEKGERVFFAITPIKRQPTTLCSVRLDGTDRRSLLRFKFADDLIPSPDGKWLAFTEQFEVYLTPMPETTAGGPPVDVALEDKGRPVFKLSQDGGYFVNWAEEGRVITWGWGPEYYRVPLQEVLKQPGFVTPEKRVVSFTEPRSIAPGQVLLTGARVITMGPAGVIEHGDVLVENGLIKAVGQAGSTTPATGARVIDVSGQTIIPGLIDVHAHYRESRNGETFPENDWGYVCQLAYGVTSIRDPSARSQSILTQAEMVETGRTLGPRIFSTGEPIYFANTAFSRPVKDLEDARLQVSRLKRLGASAVKEYILPRREQRQWLLQAAREQGMFAITEGASKFAYDLTLLMDGYTTLEHTIKTATLYRDVRSLIEKTRTYYTPTLIVGVNGSAEEYFFAHTDVLRDAKLLHYTPYNEVARYAWHPVHRPEQDYYFMKLSASTAQIMHEGGNVTLGAHGNRQGLGAHWEMWAMAMGGMSPYEVLRSATVLAAGSLGLGDDLGSLEAGKVADLVVLNRNPLEDIKNTNTVHYVMKDGRLWEGDTMDEIWPQQRKFPGFPWQPASDGKSVTPPPARDQAP